MALSTPYVSLFSGVGGLDLGLRIAFPSARCVCYCERETTAVERLVARIEEGSLDGAPIWSDVSTLDGAGFSGLRGLGVVGGFPCQDLSLAGSRAGINAGARSGLWWEYLRIIRESGAEWAFIENVPGLLCSPGINDVESGEPADGESTDWPFRNIDAVLGPLSELGFDAEWITISAADVGASHGRRRVFILAYARRRPAKPARVNGQGASDHARRAGGSVGGTLAEPASSGLPIRGDDSGLREPAAVERSGSELGDSNISDGGKFGRAQDGRREGQERFSGAGAELGDSESGEGILHARPGGSTLAASDVDRGVGDLEHATQRRGDPLGTEHGQRAPEAVVRGVEPVERARLGIFAPGPTNPIWQDVLVQRSWMRPSLSQAEAEPALCNLADGMANLLAHERTAALRGAGNGVVSLEAAVAFTILARRAGLFGF